MKLLMIANFFDATGYAETAIQTALALDSVGVDVVIRNIKLNSSVGVVPNRIKELEDKDDRNCDVVLQYTLPHLMSYNRRAGLNIGMFDYETLSFKDSSWVDKLNCMDAVWVTNQDMVEACRISGITSPVYNIPHACNVEKYQQKYEPFVIPEAEGKFIFYFVGEFNARKNFEALLRAFHTAFDRDDQVELILKTSIPGKRADETAEIVKRFCDEIKTGLKLYNELGAYKQELIITDKLAEHDMMRLHKSGNVFVAVSHGEGWNNPAIDALGIGNPVIAPRFGGFSSYLNDQNSYSVVYQLDNAFGANDSYIDLYTGNELWCDVSVENLTYQMKVIYKTYLTNPKYYQKKKIEAMKTPYLFDYNTVGNKMKEVLSAICNK